MFSRDLQGTGLCLCMYTSVGGSKKTDQNIKKASTVKRI